MTSLFALLIADLSLQELGLGFGRVANLLVGLRVFESTSSKALGVRLVRDSVFGVACGTFVSPVLAKRTIIEQENEAYLWGWRRPADVCWSLPVQRIGRRHSLHLVFQICSYISG